MIQRSFAFQMGVGALLVLVAMTGLVALGFHHQNPAQPLSWHITTTAIGAMALLPFFLPRERSRKKQELQQALQLSATKLLLQGSAPRQSA